MSYARNRREDAAKEEPSRSTNCPAHGCPNAASVSLDGSRYACYQHAKADPSVWPEVTRTIMDRWPASANWNHPAKLSHEGERAAERRAKLPDSWRGVRAVGAFSVGEEAGRVTQ